MNLFTENGYSNEQIETVLFSKCFNPYELKNELKVLKSFINSQVGINFQKAFKRLSSIKEEKSELNFDIKIFNATKSLVCISVHKN